MSTYLCLPISTYLLTFDNLPTYVNLPTPINILTYLYQHTYLPVILPTHVNLPSFTYLHLPIPKFQYIIAADQGAVSSLVVVLVVGFFVWSMPYQLPPPCYPQFFKYFKLSLSTYPSSSIFICQSINRPLPFPKYQSIIAADRGAGIGLVGFFVWSMPYQLPPLCYLQFY